MKKTEAMRRDKERSRDREAERDREKVNGEGINILGSNIWEPKEAETRH